MELDHPEKSGDQGRLAGPCPAHNPNLGVGGGNAKMATILCLTASFFWIRKVYVHLGASHNVHTDVLQYKGKVRTISEVDGRHQNSTLCCKDFAIALRGFETIARNLFPMK